MLKQYSQLAPSDSSALILEFQNLERQYELFLYLRIRF